MLRDLLLCGVLFAVPLLGYAQGGPQLSAGPTLTGTGIGVGATAQFSPKLSASAELNGMPFGSSIDLGDVEGVRYNVDLSIWSLSVMGHVHPFGGRFALGAGLFFGGYGLKGTGVPEGVVEIGDQTYTAAQLGTAEANFRLGGPAPVFELGRRGRGFNVGLGVILPVNVKADVNFIGPIADDPTFRQELDKEIESIKDEVRYVSILPFLRLGYQIGF